MSKFFEYIKKYNILILVLLGFLIYYPSLFYDFLDYDDFSLILKNQYLNGNVPVNFSDFFIPKFIRDDIYIPLTFIMYWSIIKIFGINSFAFHFVNIFFYVSSSIVLFYLLKKIIDNYSVVFFAVILYILHPCHIENTVWVSAIGYNIASFFFFLSFLYFIIACDENKKINYVYSVVFYMFAILSQPIAITLLAILVLWIYCFRRERLKGSIKYICAYIPFLLIYLYLYSHTVLKTSRFEDNINYSIWEKLSILGFDLFNSFIPINLCPIHSIPNFYFIISLFIFVIICYYFRKNNIFLFFSILGIISIMPYSNLFFDMFIPSSDRYLLFLSISSSVFISYFSFYILEKFNNSNLLKYISFIFFIFLYLFSFLIYIPNWKNSRYFWLYNYNFSENLVSMSGYSQILLEEHKYDEALTLADKLIKKAPMAFEGYEIKIRALVGKGYLNDSLTFALKVKELMPENYEIYFYLFDIYIAMQDYENAQKSLDIVYVKANEQKLYKNEVFNSFLNKKMILFYVLVEPDKFIDCFKIISNNFNLLNDNGHFYDILNENDYNMRKRICLNYLEQNSEYSKSVIRLLSCLYMKKTYKEEASEVMKSILKDMRSAQSFINKGDYISAEKIYLSVISKNNYMYDSYYNLGILYLNSNRQNEAKKIFSKMLKINPNDEQIKQILESLGKENK